ncbi:hypothetical protein WN943_021818 [Citrus x changshan-huyou]
MCYPLISQDQGTSEDEDDSGLRKRVKLPTKREEIEIEAKVLRVGKAVAVVSVELRKKDTGKIVAQGRHTKYLAISSKM